VASEQNNKTIGVMKGAYKESGEENQQSYLEAAFSALKSLKANSGLQM